MSADLRAEHQCTASGAVLLEERLLLTASSLVLSLEARRLVINKLLCCP